MPAKSSLNVFWVHLASSAVPSPADAGAYSPPRACLFPFTAMFQMETRNPDDCRTFGHYANGYEYLRECPVNLYYNEAIDSCDYRENVSECR